MAEYFVLRVRRIFTITVIASESTEVYYSYYSFLSSPSSLKKSPPLFCSNTPSPCFQSLSAHYFFRDPTFITLPSKPIPSPSIPYMLSSNPTPLSSLSEPSTCLFFSPLQPLQTPPFVLSLTAPSPPLALQFESLLFSLLFPPPPRRPSHPYTPSSLFPFSPSLFPPR